MDDQATAVSSFPDKLHQLQARESGHLIVRDDQIEPVERIQQQIPRVGPIGRILDGVPGPGQKLYQQTPDIRIVVNTENSE